MEDICSNGGNVAVLDMNRELGEAVVKDLAPSAAFFLCDVRDTESIASAVKGTVEWASQTGKPLGGVIPAAGIGGGATVCRNPDWMAGADETDPRSRWKTVQPGKL